MTTLPSSLKNAIEQLITATGLKGVNQARAELTMRYQDINNHSPRMTTDLQRYSYILTRLPATYAAITAALQSIKDNIDFLHPKTVLDLGTGPGTALWAINEYVNNIELFTLMEQDKSLIQLGQQLIKWSENCFPKIDWQQTQYDQLANFPRHDIVISSYSLGELPSSSLIPVITKAWEATQQLLIIIEPGTPVGFERIRLIRDYLIQQGAYLLAPCPHYLSCPMTNGDWCHFAARVERSAIHRKVKEASLSYEDEKFSYLIFSKICFDLPEARVLRHPIHHSGHIQLKLCTKEGIQEPTISRKMGNLYKKTKKMEWGSAFF